MMTSEEATVEEPESEQGPEHAPDHEVEPEPEAVLTESLAMLYRGQGHLVQAVAVLDALVARAPENTGASLVARRNVVRRTRHRAAPVHSAAAESGGRPLRELLSTLAASRAEPAASKSGVRLIL